MGVPLADQGVHEKAGPAAGLLRRADFAQGGDRRARLPRDPQDAGGAVQVRAGLGDQHEVLAPEGGGESRDGRRGRHSSC